MAMVVWTFVVLCILSLAEPGPTLEEEEFRFQRAVSDYLPALQSTVDGLAQHLSEVTAELATLKTKYSDMEARLNAAQTNVAFYAYHARDPFTVTAHGTIVYDTVPTNIGNAYDAKTGFFRAPVAGTYVFFSNCMAVESTSEEARILLEDQAIASCYSWRPDPGEPFEQGATLVTVHVAAGQTVRVQLLEPVDENMRGWRYNSFSGFLVRPDPPVNSDL